MPSVGNAPTRQWGAGIVHLQPEIERADHATTAPPEPSPASAELPTPAAPLLFVPHTAGTGCRPGQQADVYLAW